MPDVRLGRLALFTNLGVALLVVWGGIVRVTESGMGCPDWPTCFGELAPPTHLGAAASMPAWIEMMHRYGALLVALLVGATAVLAWRHRERAAPWRWALAAAFIVALQIVLGAITVWQQNAPWTVTAHLAAALALLACTTATTVLAYEPAGGPLRLDPAGWALLGATGLTALVGSVVQTTGGGWVCPDLPFCQEQVWPAALGLPATAHMLHRGLVLVTAVVLVVVARAGWQAGGTARRSAIAALATFGLQALIGITLVVAGMPDALRAGHLMIATAYWVGVVALVLRLAAARASRAAAPSPVALAQMAS